MRKAIFVLITVFILGICGCGEEKFSRYPSVSIPEFSSNDYYAQLSDKNQQVVYNAIVNLGEKAAEFGKLLSDANADKNSPEYITANKTYHKITELLKSPDANTVAVSLRFLKLFAEHYNKKEELLKPILKIESTSPQVTFEQIAALEVIVAKGSAVSDSVLRKFLNNPSWLVSRKSYLLIDKLENENLRNELIKRYKTAPNEKEKLLILTALASHSSDSTANFFFKEIITSNNAKVRYAVYDILGNCNNHEMVLTWFAQNYRKILPNDRKYLFGHYAAQAEEYFSSKLLTIFINNGFPIDENFYKSLYEKIEKYTSGENALSPKGKAYLSNLRSIEKALIGRNDTTSYWQSLLKEKQVLNEKTAKMQTEYDAAAREFSVKADAIFTKYGVSEAKRKEYTDIINASGADLRALFEPDQEAKPRE